MEDLPISCTPVSTHRDLGLARAFERLSALCVEGITINDAHLRTMSSRGVGVVTGLTRCIGYATAAEITKTLLAGAADVRQLVRATAASTEDALDDLLSLERLAGISDGRQCAAIP